MPEQTKKANLTKILLYLSAFINLVIIGYVGGKRIYYYRSGLPENREDIKALKDYNKKRNKQLVDFFKVLPHLKTDIVFVGTSLTEAFHLQEMFKDARLVNRGIGGNTTQDVINRLSEVTDGMPNKIFLEVGTNDIGEHTIDYTFNQLRRIVDTIRAKTPQTKLYIQSVLPFGTTFTPKIEAYNKRVQLYCNTNGITFINLYPLFLGNGAMKPELTTDGIHLTAKGYLIWKSQIADLINQQPIR